MTFSADNLAQHIDTTPPPKKRMGFRSITDEQFAAADKIVKEDGKPVTQAAKETGISAQTLYKRYRPSGDPTPGGRRKKISKPGPTDEQLQDLFTKAAVLPAIPAAAVLHCDFCAAHFVTEGPKAAAQLVDLSKDSPALRSMMEWMWGQWETVAWSALLLTWIGIPVAHHAAPDFIYGPLQLVTKLPPRGVPVHDHAAAPNGNGTAPGPTPFAGLDMESLMAMARSMGVNFHPPVAPDAAIVNDEPIGDDAATPEPPAADDAEVADSTETSETVTSDPDADK